MTSEANEEVLHDMHQADVMALLKKRGITLAEVSRRAGYKHPQTLHRALYARWPKGERIIACALGMKPEDVWPTRYAPKALDNIKIPHRTVA